MPEQNKPRQITDNHINSSVQIEDSDETFEYFSDREEAEKHKKAGKQKPPII
jgi:hypothetical protein